MEHAYLHFLHLLAGHPGWTETVVFLAAFLESVAIVGTFIPGSTAMFLAGALVGAGALDIWATLLWAVAGAVAGDGLSYWLGRRYKTQLAAAWPFRRHPEVLEKGQAFFTAQGGKSILLARFLGPVRAIVPVVAGMLGMPPARFIAVNVLSALAWGPAHILPGVVFGASLQLAGAVTFRLVIVLVLFAALVWLTLRIVRIVLSRIVPWFDASGARLLAWSRRKPNRFGRLSRFVQRMFDANQSALRPLAAMGGLLLLGCWMFLAVLQDILARDPLVNVDAAAYHFLQALRTPWGDTVMAAVAALGSGTTLVAVVLAVTAWFAWQKQWQTIGYWLATTGFSQLLILAIKFAVAQPPPASPGLDIYAFPSGHVASGAVVYGFLAFLLARQRRKSIHLIVSVASLLVVLIAVAGLYLGTYWLSDALGGVALGLVWVALMSLAYAYHCPPGRYAAGMPALVAVVIVASASFQLRGNAPAQAPRNLGQEPPVIVTQAQWRTSVGLTLPVYRTDMEGDRHERFNVQWAARPEDIRRQLMAQGWIAPKALSASDLLTLLSPHATAMQLPVFPKLNAGIAPELMFVHASDQPDARFVLRLWPTLYRVSDGASAGESAEPLWIGAVIRERVHPLWLINLVRTDRSAPLSPQTLASLLEQGERQAPASTELRDRPVLLPPVGNASATPATR